MRNLTKAITVISLLGPVSGYPLGIGDIRVRSALNQNLNAEISLVLSRGENPDSIKVALAPSEKFDEAGVPWSYFLSKIKFKPVVKSNGSMVIKVTSREALKEPFLNFLIEVTWPKGNLYREFTVLVDPPTEYQEPAYPLSQSYETNYPPVDSPTAYVPRQRSVRHVTRPRRVVQANNYGGQIVTRKNDTLWRVAERSRGGSGLSVEQMMMALYEKNPSAFYQPNVNALLAGKRLKIPDKDAVQQLSRQDALAEFGRHNNAWKNHTQLSSEPIQEAREEVVDSQLKLVAPNDGSVASNESVNPSAEQNASTSKGGTSSQPSAGKGSGNEKSAAVDDAIQGKVAALEKQLAMMQELIALKDKQLADLQNPAKVEDGKQTLTPKEPGIENIKPEVLPQEITEPQVQVKPEQPAQINTTGEPIPPTPVEIKPPKPITPVSPSNVKTTTPKPNVEDADNSYPWILGGVAAGLLSLFGWLWRRKQRMLEEAENESMFGNYSTIREKESIGSSPTSVGKAGAESSFLSDFKQSDFEAFESFNVDHSDIDPVAEADVYLAYGRYQQAEELILHAIKEYPDRDDCKLKLLEIYQSNANKEAFIRYATDFSATSKKDDKNFWSKVVEFGKIICPDSDLFKTSEIVTANEAVFAPEGEAFMQNLDSPVIGAAHETDIDSLEAADFTISDDEADALAFETTYETTSNESFSDDVGNPEVSTQLTNKKVGFEQSTGEPNFDDEIADKNHEQESSTDQPISYLQEVSHPDMDDFEALTPINNTGAEAYKRSDITVKDDLDAFEFDLDLNFNKNEIKATGKPFVDQSQDSWDPDQTIDFSLDSTVKTEKISKTEPDLDFGILDTSSTVSNEFNFDTHDFAVADLTDMDEIETKLDLAKAYIDMGDTDSARDIIGQVIEKGSSEQKKVALTLLEDLALE